MPTISLTRASPGSRDVYVRAPFDPPVIDAIKAMPGREWNKSLKMWRFPATPESVRALHSALTAAGYELHIPVDLQNDLRRELDALETARGIKAKGDAAVDFAFRTEPYAHQRAGLAFLAGLESGALLWEMGLGKTKTAIDYAEWLATQPQVTEQGRFVMTILAAGRNLRVLVIAPNTVLRNWGLEIEKHAGHTDFAMLGGLSTQKRIALLGTARYTLVNCEALSMAPFAEAARKVEWDLVIVDESTRFKTPKAARTKALLKLRAKHRVILTGTPITGKPEDAWAQLEFVAPGLLGSFWRFKDRYLATDWFGNTIGVHPAMMPELAAKIDSRSYRILKSQVLDLPPKVYADRRVTLAGDQMRAYRQMRDELRVEIEGNQKLTANNILTMLLRLTQITAGLIGSSDQGYTWLEDGAKLAEMDALLNDELRGEQVVIFGLYQRELEELARRYTDGGQDRVRSGYALPIIYGPTPAAARQELIEQFQEGSRRLLFAQSRTGGIGINLTAAQTAIYYTRGWGLEEYLQSQDRLHRIGQTGTVTILHLVAEETIDEQIAAALTEKQQLADHLTGDTVRRLTAQVLKR